MVENTMDSSSDDEWELNMFQNVNASSSSVGGGYHGDRLSNRTYPRLSAAAENEEQPQKRHHIDASTRDMVSQGFIDPRVLLVQNPAASRYPSGEHGGFSTVRVSRSNAQQINYNDVPAPSASQRFIHTAPFSTNSNVAQARQYRAVSANVAGEHVAFNTVQQASRQNAQRTTLNETQAPDVSQRPVYAGRSSTNNTIAPPRGYIVTEDNRFECIQCGAIIRNREDMCRHKNSVHTQKRAVICSACGGRFSRSDNLRRHQRENCPARYQYQN